MTKELLFRAQDLYDCISGNRSALTREQEKIQKLIRMGSRDDGTITIQVNEEIGLANVLVEDIIKASEQRCEMLKGLMEKYQTEFDNL
jgi:ATP-dependent protease HslVU (ClpYQ) ATPase subunit